MVHIVDTDTILGAQAGQPDQVTALYEYYHARVFRYLVYRVGNRQIAEDLTSEVFLRMIRNLGSYRFQGSSAPFQAWLFQIAHNLVTDYIRRTSNYPQTALTEDLATADPLPEARLEYRLTHERLYRALSGLGEDQREVVILRFIVGFSILETARALHKSEDAVKGLQRRGLSALREILADPEAHHV